jgi:hypothetical protein
MPIRHVAHPSGVHGCLFNSFSSIGACHTFIGALVIAFCISYFLLRFLDKIPTKHPIPKALILSFVVLVIIEALSTLGNPSNAYVCLLVDTTMNIPRFLALGIVIGYLYDRLNATA